MGGQRGHLEERRADVEQALHPLARQQLAAAGVTRARRLRPAQGRLRGPGVKQVDQGPVMGGVGLETVGRRRQGRGQLWQVMRL